MHTCPLSSWGGTAQDPDGACGKAAGLKLDTNKSRHNFANNQENTVVIWVYQMSTSGYRWIKTALFPMKIAMRIHTSNKLWEGQGAVPTLDQEMGRAADPCD